MTLAFMLPILGIALVDSLNPSLFLAQFYLLTTPRPTGRIISYIAGVITVNFIGGLMILGGVRWAVAAFLNQFSGEFLTILQLVIGAVVFIFGIWYQAAPQANTDVQKPRSQHLVHAFILGMVVMVNEITTAFPYFIAIEQIAQAGMTTGLSLFTLAAYNLVFSLPLFGFLGLFLMYRNRVMIYIERIQNWMNIWIPRVIKGFSIGFGTFLILNASVAFIS